MIQILRLGPDTGGEYLPALQVDHRDDFLPNLKPGAAYRGEVIAAVDEPWPFPEFIVVDVEMTNGAQHSFLVPR